MHRQFLVLLLSITTLTTTTTTTNSAVATAARWCNQGVCNAHIAGKHGFKTPHVTVNSFNTVIESVKF